MDKLSGFQITGMSLSGFKSYLNPTELTFGNPTVITGGNGKGKSSIADAIAFAVTGLPFFGERGIDRLHSDDAPELFVALRFIDGEGVAHELTRTRYKGRMTITYDGYEIRQHNLTDLFGEKDVFLSIFNPLYFIEELGDSGKSLLERYLPAVTHEEVLATLNEPARASLEHEPLLSPEVYLKRQREAIRELEEAVIYLTGQKDLAETQGRDGEKKTEERAARLAALDAEIGTLEEKQFSGLDLAGLREQLTDLSARYEDMAKEGAGDSARSETDDQIARLHRKLAERKAAQYEPKYTQPIADTEARIKALGQRYQREMALYQGFHAGMVCPTCRRAVTDADIGTVREELKKSILEIGAAGKEQASQREELRVLEQKARDAFLQFQADDVAALERGIEEAAAACSAAGPDSGGRQRRDALDALRQNIQELTTTLEYGTLTQEEYDQLQSSREERRTVEAELNAVKNISANSAQEYGVQIAQAQEQIAALKKRIGDVALYVSHRAELTFSKLKMNRVAISLYDVVKTTGEAKDAFRFTYNGRRYDRLSLSEKIRAGMEVSELMKRLTGRNYPVFVDNMESVEELSNVRPTGQVIMAKCVPMAELMVKAGGVSQAQSKAA